MSQAANNTELSVKKKRIKYFYQRELQNSFSSLVTLGAQTQLPW